MKIYLACPYIHADRDVIESRVVKASKAAGYFMDKGDRVYSPITHGHYINAHMDTQEGDHKFWLNQCYPDVVSAEAVYVLAIQGWNSSKGVRWEVETAFAFNVPVYIVDPTNYELSELKNPGWKIEEIYRRDYEQSTNVA